MGRVRKLRRQFSVRRAAEQPARDPAISMSEMSPVRVRWVGSRPLVPCAGATLGWARGYAFTSGDSNRLLEDDAIVRFLAERASDVVATSAALNGSFAAVLVSKHDACIVTDRYGSIPLYIDDGRGGIVLGDDPWAVVAARGTAPRLDQVAAFEMLRAGHVVGQHTLVAGVSTVPPATVVRFVDGVRSDVRYWRYAYGGPHRSYEEHEARAVRAFTSVAARVDAYAPEQHRDVVLMLTGGLDTRLLGALLATRTSAHVRAVSYGSTSDDDVVVARTVADAVGFPFTFVPVTSDYLDDEFVRRSVRQVGITTRFSCGTGARLAPLSRNDVVITGHTGFLSSDLTWHHWPVRTRHSVESMCWLRNFAYPGIEHAVRDVVRFDETAMRRASFDETLADFDPAADPIGEMQRWNNENRQRNLVLMEYRAIEDRARWMFPLGDDDVVDVFCDIGYDLRLGQRLNKAMGFDHLFEGRAQSLGQVPRVGDPLAHTPEEYRRFHLVQRLQPLSAMMGVPVVRAARSLRARARTAAPRTSGPVPFRYWFHTEPRVRQFFLRRIDDLDPDLVDRGALRALVVDERTPDIVFERLLAGALTIPETLDEADRAWRRGAEGA
jgi:hypothetical protein